jgi:hypothetical protein
VMLMLKDLNIQKHWKGNKLWRKYLKIDWFDL